MKLFWMIALALAIIILGCISEPSVKMDMYNISDTEISFKEGVGFVRGINGSISELESFNRTLNEYPQTRDTDALLAFVEIEIYWTKAKASLESGSSEKDLCKSYEFLQAFIGNAAKTIQLMEMFMETYSEFTEHTNINSETVQEISSNIISAEFIIENPDFDACRR